MTCTIFMLYSRVFRVENAEPEVSPSTRFAIASSADMHLGQNLVHLGGGECPHRCRVDVAQRSQVQEQGGGRVVISGFKDQHAVVIAQGPVDVRDLDAHLLRSRLHSRRPLRGFVNGVDALLGEFDGGDESCHVSVSFQENHWWKVCFIALRERLSHPSPVGSPFFIAFVVLAGSDVSESKRHPIHSSIFHYRCFAIGSWAELRPSLSCIILTKIGWSFSGRISLVMRDSKVRPKYATLSLNVLRFLMNQSIEIYSSGSSRVIPPCLNPPRLLKQH